MASSFNISVGADTSKLERDIQQAAARLRKPIDIRVKDNASSALGNITGKTTKFNDALDAATARVVAFGAAAGAFNLVRKGVEELLRSTVEVEASLTRININLNETQDGLKQFSKNIFDIARNTGQTFETAAKAAEELTRQGLSATETTTRLRDALILSRLAAIDSDEAVKSLTASINSFSKEALSGTEILNKLAAVDAKFAVSTADLAAAISRVGSSASDAGVSFDQLLGIVTSVQQTTARGGAVIGNSLKTIFTRIERSSTLDDLEALGIGVRDIQGKTLPAIQILTELAKTYDTLSDAQRSAVAEQVGGVFQINILKALLGDLNKEYSIYTKALQVSSRASDEAFRKNEILNKTLASSFNELRQSITQLFAEFGKINLNPVLKAITDGLTGISKFLSGSDVGKDAGKSIGENIMQGIGNVLTGPGVIALAAIVQSVISTLARKVGAEFGDAVASSMLKAGILGGSVQAGKIAQVRKIVPRAAGGLLPSVAGEMASINSGVGGATRSAKPVVIPNFNFGGGKRGPVVANTDEYMVPNFAGTGGSAIFNRNMVSMYGLPRGAKKLAEGYVPNFAMGTTNAALRLQELNAANPKILGQLAKMFGVKTPVAQGAHSVVFETPDGSQVIKVLRPTGSDNYRNKVERGDSFNRIAKATGFDNFYSPKARVKKLGGVDVLMQDRVDGETIDDALMMVEKNMRLKSGSTLMAQDKIMANLTEAFRSDAFMGKADSLGIPRNKRPIFDNATTSMRNFMIKRSSLPLFQHAVMNATPTTDFAKTFKSLGVKVAAIDLANGFIPNFAKISARKISGELEKKRRLSTESGSELEYLFNPKKRAIEIDHIRSQKKGDAFQLFTALTERSRRSGLPIYSGVLSRQYGAFDPKTKKYNEIAFNSEYSNYENLIRAYPQLRYRDQPGLKNFFNMSMVDTNNQDETFYKKFRSLGQAEKFVNNISKWDFARYFRNDQFSISGLKTFAKAGGYVPNFANPLSAAIAREKAAGVPSSQIYIDRDRRIMSKNNPLGLLVANRNDEPLGGHQGVTRMLKQGRNPFFAGLDETYDATHFYNKARGYVPNFALTPQESLSLGGLPLRQGGVEGFIKGLDLSKINFDTQARNFRKQITKTIEDSLNIDISKLSSSGKRSYSRLVTEIIAVRGEDIEKIKQAQIAQRNKVTRSSGGLSDEEFQRAKYGPKTEPNIPTPFDDVPVGQRGAESTESSGFMPKKRKRFNVNRTPEDIAGRREEANRLRELRRNRPFLPTLFPSVNKPFLNDLRKGLGFSQETKGRLSLGLAIAAPAAAAFVPQGQGGTTRGIVGGAAAGALQGAGAGALFGFGGAAAGAAIGGLIGAFSKSKKSIEEFSESIDKASVATQKNIQGFSSILSISEQLKETADPKIRDRLLKNIEDILPDLTPQARARVKEGFGSTEDIQKLMANVLREATKTERIGAAAKEFFITENSRNSGLAGGIRSEKLIDKFGLFGAAINEPLKRFVDYFDDTGVDKGQAASAGKLLGATLTEDIVKKLTTRSASSAIAKGAAGPAFITDGADTMTDIIKKTFFGALQGARRGAPLGLGGVTIGAGVGAVEAISLKNVEEINQVDIARIQELVDILGTIDDKYKGRKVDETNIQALAIAVRESVFEFNNLKKTIKEVDTVAKARPAYKNLGSFLGVDFGQEQGFQEFGKARTYDAYKNRANLQREKSSTFLSTLSGLEAQKAFGDVGGLDAFLKTNQGRSLNTLSQESQAIVGKEGLLKIVNEFVSGFEQFSGATTKTPERKIIESSVVYLLKLLEKNSDKQTAALSNLYLELINQKNKNLADLGIKPVGQVVEGGYTAGEKLTTYSGSRENADTSKTFTYAGVPESAKQWLARGAFSGNGRSKARQEFERAIEIERENEKFKNASTSISTALNVQNGENPFVTTTKELTDAIEKVKNLTLDVENAFKVSVVLSPDAVNFVSSENMAAIERALYTKINEIQGEVQKLNGAPPVPASKQMPITKKEQSTTAPLTTDIIKNAVIPLHSW